MTIVVMLHWSVLLNGLGRLSCCCRSSSFFHSYINSNLSISSRSWSRCWSRLSVWLFLASREVLFPVIFVLSEVMVKVSIVVAMVFTLPLHFISIRVLDIVIRLRVRVVVVNVGLVVTVHVMGCMMGRVPSLLLFIVVFAGSMSFVVVTEISLVLMLI